MIWCFGPALRGRLRKIWDDHSLDLCEQSELFHAHALPFVLFLQQSRAAFVPESVPVVPFDPG